MRRWLCLAGLLFASSFTWAAGPRLQFRETQFDFGVLRQGGEATHRFSFRNNGSDPLSIEHISTSCGCTAAVSSTHTVLPGEFAFLDVSFDSRGRSGEINKTVRIRTNDPRTPTAVLRVVGLVAPPVHPPRREGDRLFAGSCRACHVDRGVGKKGAALYAAVCASCHESARRGGQVRAPTVDALSLLDGRTLGKSIAEGAHGAGIDGFYDKRGGVLTKAQIKSLIRYLQSLKETP